MLHRHPLKWCGLPETPQATNLPWPMSSTANSSELRCHRGANGNTAINRAAASKSDCANRLHQPDIADAFRSKIASATAEKKKIRMVRIGGVGIR